MIRTVIGIVAAGIALVQVVPYLVSIVRGHTRPSRAAYAIWAGVETIAAVSYLAAGGAQAGWVRAAYALTAIVVFGFALRYGVGGAGPLDWLGLAVAAAALAAWIATGRPELAASITLIATIAGYTPTIIKAASSPGTENVTSWALTVTASTLALTTLASPAPVIVAIPAVNWAGAVIVLVLLLKGQRLTT